MRRIEVDFDVHKVIEAERRSFDEDANVVLRRLLNLPNKNRVLEVNDASHLEQRSWVDGDIVLPAGTQLRMTYNNSASRAVIRDGRWWDEEGGVHDSPSGAAIALARTKAGKKTNLNGKNYWYVKRPGDESWILYADLEARESKST